jgi:hypothetical protein
MSSKEDVESLICEARIVRRRALLTLLKNRLYRELWRHSIEASQSARRTAAEMRRGLEISGGWKKEQ